MPPPRAAAAHRFLSKILKIATWNVNSIRERLPHVIRWIQDENPDVLCLQEIKCIQENFPKTPLEDLGYNIAICGQKAYNGVAILSKAPLDILHTTLPGDPSDTEARYLEVLVKSCRLANLYLPNGNPTDSEKFTKKLAWMERLYNHAQTLIQSEETVVLAGDFNVIPTPADVYDPDAVQNDACFHPAVRHSFASLLHLGFADAYRTLHEETHYTFWGYRGGAWQRDAGMRIDHMLLSPEALQYLGRAHIAKKTRSWKKPSDHVPLWICLSKRPHKSEFRPHPQDA